MREADYIRSKLGGERHFLVGESYVRDNMNAAFQRHKSVARQRKIDFELSFDDWAKIWLDSGHWFRRGKRKGQYVMGRFEDTGPYAKNNVTIITNRQNIQDAQRGREQTVQTRRRHAKSNTGHTITIEHRAKLSAANNGRKPWKGNPCSDATRQRMSQSAKISWVIRRSTS